MDGADFHQISLVFLSALAVSTAARARDFSPPVVALAAASIRASGVGPGFPCPRPDAATDALAQMICDDGEMSTAELSFEQTCYVFRALVGPAGYHQVKVDAVAADAAVRRTCGFPTAGTADQTLPKEAKACYVRTIAAAKEQWNGRLTGNPLQEASRSVAANVGLQRRLIDLGFLPAGTAADGIFGDGTRAAIVAWKKRAGVTEPDTFLSDAARLSTAPAPVAAPFQALAPTADGELVPPGGPPSLHLSSSTPPAASATPPAAARPAVAADPSTGAEVQKEKLAGIDGDVDPWNELRPEQRDLYCSGYLSAEAKNIGAINDAFASGMVKLSTELRHRTFQTQLSSLCCGKLARTFVTAMLVASKRIEVETHDFMTQSSPIP